jgi:hypothetical protein
VANDIHDVRFFSGGNAVFTVHNAQGTHYTYKIRKPRAFADRPNPPYFVKLLTGPSNESDYTYLGIFIPQHNEIRLTAKSKYTVDSIPVKVVQWAIKRVADNKSLPDGYAIQHEGRCCRCRRVLTTPESIDRGIGPECIKHFA